MRMEEWADLGHLSYSPAPQLWTGAPFVSEFCLERYSSVVSAATRLQGILNSIICKPVSVICAPLPFLTAEHEKSCFLCVFFKGTLGLFGGGGRAPQAPPPLGPALAIEKFYFYIFTWMPYAWPLCWPLY